MLFKVLKTVLIFTFLSLEIFAQSNSQCLNCHLNTSKKVSKKFRINYNLFKKSVHGNLDCVDCHENVNSSKIPHLINGKSSKVNCGNCHDDVDQSFKNDFHNRFVKNTGKQKPGCVSCHGKHYIKSPEKIKNKTKTYCNKCHNNVLFNFSENYHSLKQISKKVCGDCHEADLIEDTLKVSVHNNLICSDCHRFEALNREKHQEGVNYVQLAKCSTCHKKEFLLHKKSIHGVSLTEGIEDAAKCWNCHGGHNILKVTNKKSPVYFDNIPATCIKCHGNKEFQKRHKEIIANSSIKFYRESVHGKLIATGNSKAANCISCHGVHDIKNIIQPGSKISPFNLPNTCGKCHPKETKEYKESIHWLYVERGVKLAPVCNDCHSEHSIENILGSKNRNKVMEIEKATCISCHSNKILSKRFGLSGTQPNAYEDSYHGMAAARGDKRVALCTDCHGVHKILPKNNPASTVNIKNVKQTCSKCHRQATQVFSESYSHKAITAKGAYLEKIVTKIYCWLIIIVIGGMIIHNLIIFIFELRKKARKEKAQPAVPRFSGSEIYQHLLLIISFSVLALTGFALKFPNSWYSITLNNIGLIEPVRQIVHRVAAVILVLDAIYHVCYLFTTKRGKYVLKGILPKLEDFKDLLNNLKYYLHLKRTPPAFEQFDYAEKAEYWALVWGVIVMGFTGFILWFPTVVGNWAPPWLIHISELIHFYEAVLATLAIIVWHWFFVIFHPAQYPMSLTWLNGEQPINEYSRHHKKHVYNIILEWMKYKNGDKEFNELSNDIKDVIEYLRKKGEDEERVFNDVINKNSDLKNWLEEKFLNNKEKKLSGDKNAKAE